MQACVGDSASGCIPVAVCVSGSLCCPVWGDDKVDVWWVATAICAGLSAAYSGFGGSAKGDSRTANDGNSLSTRFVVHARECVGGKACLASMLICCCCLPVARSSRVCVPDDNRTCACHTAYRYVRRSVAAAPGCMYPYGVRHLRHPSRPRKPNTGPFYRYCTAHNRHPQLSDTTSQRPGTGENRFSNTARAPRRDLRTPRTNERTHDTRCQRPLSQFNIDYLLSH